MVRNQDVTFPMESVHLDGRENSVKKEITIILKNVCKCVIHWDVFIKNSFHYLLHRVSTKVLRIEIIAKCAGHCEDNE